jgi:hypothetical protein
MANPTLQPTRTESDYLLSYKKIDSVTTIIRYIVMWGGLCFIAYCGYLCVAVLAGRATSANIFIKIFGSATISRGLMVLLAGGGWVYGLGQQYLRRRNIQRIVPAKNALERKLDPKRSSSHLTERGTTQPGDDQ